MEEEERERSREAKRWAKAEVVAEARAEAKAEAKAEAIAEAKAGQTKVRIAVVQFWERLYFDEGKDVEILASDGSVWAHKVVLLNLSESLNAMLSAGMRETHTSKIHLPDYTVAQLRFTLRLVYTGHADPSDYDEADAGDAGDSAPQSAPPLDLIFGCASFAKRFEVPGFVSFMVDMLKDRIDISNFDRVTRFSISLDMAPLKLFCLRFAEDHLEVRQQFQQGSLSPEVEFELQALWVTPVSQRGHKRKILC